jgi:hypothetical protein
VEHPDRVLRRLAPDPVQVQVILGSLLGDARLTGRPDQRRLAIAHSRRRAEYVLWKYDRLRSLAAGAPAPTGHLLEFETIAHPLFDDLVPLFYCDGLELKRIRRDAVMDLLTPLGLAVWLADLGRLELGSASFTPKQQLAVLRA